MNKKNPSEFFAGLGTTNETKVLSQSDDLRHKNNIIYIYGIDDVKYIVVARGGLWSDANTDMTTA